MRTKLTSLALAAVMTLAAAGMAYTDTGGGPLHAEAAYQQRFRDVPEHHWAVTYIEEMAENGILAGYPDGNFYPDKKITRAEFAKIMTVAAGMNIDMSDTATIFEDVSADDWFAPYVKRAQYYLSGYTTIMVEGSTYRPNQLALREDITVAMVKLKGYSVDGVDGSTLQTLITDSSSVSEDAQKYIVVAIQRGLISGYEDGTFRGQSSITRAEAAAIMWRAFQYGNDNKLFDYNTPNPTASPTPTVIPTLTPTRRPTTRPTVRPTTRPAARPTVRPASEEPLIPTQKPTPRPTAKPTATPEPTPTPEPERPYVMDTVTDASITNTFQLMTTDDKRYIYYYDTNDNAIYSLDMYSEDIERIADLSDVKMAHQIDKGEETVTEYYKNLSVDQIYYDLETDKLILKGVFRNLTDSYGLNDKNVNYSVILDVFDDFRACNKNEVNNPIVSGSESLLQFNIKIGTNSYRFERKTGSNSDSGIVHFFSNAKLYKYNFNIGEWEVIRNSEEDSEIDGHYIGYHNNEFYIWHYSSVFKCALNTKLSQLDIDTENDVQVMDFKVVPQSPIDRSANQFFIRDDECFFFYSNNSIRVMKKR